MRPILYPPEERAFDSNGLGVLSDAASCQVTEERNGGYELTMQYPVSGIHYADIAERCLILARPRPEADPQPFRVYRITRPMGGLVTVYAEHISYDLSGAVMPPFSAQGVQAVFAAIASGAIPADNGFSYWTDRPGATSVSSSVPLSVRSLLGGVKGSILDIYGGEYEFDRFTVRLWTRRGADRGVVIRYGKDLTSLEQDANCAAVYTAVYPYWTGEETTVELPEKTVPVSGTFDFTRILTLDLSSAFEDAPTADQLRTAAEYYIADNKVGVPRVSITLSFAQLDGEKVELCDTVSVVFAAMGVTATAKVVKTTFDVLRDRYSSVEVGSVRSSVADTIAGQAQDISSLPTTEALQKAILNATGWITGTNGGYVIFKRNDAGQATELLIMDAPETADAKNVWRWNLGGLGFSSNGINGPYETAITQDGSIVGKFVTAEGLDVYAANIVGKLTAAQIDADNLQVKAANVTGQLVASQIDASSLHVNAANVDGQLQASQINADNLHVNAANVDGQLQASQIDADNLHVNAANITGQLVASQIDATNLQVNGANIYNLTVTNAQIENLECAKLIGYMPAARLSDATHPLSELSVSELTTNHISCGTTIRVGGVGNLVDIGGAGVSKNGGGVVSWDTILSGGNAVFG